MNNLSPYVIGDIPNFNPCDKCILKVKCSDNCDEKLLYLRYKKKSEKVIIRLSKRRRKKK